MEEILQVVVEAIKLIGFRKLIFISFVLVVMFTYLRQRENRYHSYRKRELVEETYEKNEEGLYPWEADTDDSPERIAKDAKRYVNTHGPKRGRW
ncbi:hypothetical protein IGI37_003209 [Enterococcus sp. AZ194]|uniref:hypothetical protein n=1 Tax=Enterococcus sp. AZ194 TaxID=2774629 RepID=UPI003F2603C3